MNRAILLQTALAQAKQEHWFCVKHGVGCKTQFLQNMGFCADHGLNSNQSLCVNQAFGKGDTKRCSAQQPVDGQAAYISRIGVQNEARVGRDVGRVEHSTP